MFYQKCTMDQEVRISMNEWSKCHMLGEAEKLRAVLETFLNKMMIYLVVRVFPITSLQKVHNRIPTYKFLHIRGTSVSIFFCLIHRTRHSPVCKFHDEVASFKTSKTVYVTLCKTLY